MKLPGKGWLEFEATPHDMGTSLRQTAYFAPRGVFGRLYWYTLAPFHVAIFGRMARKIVEAAEVRSSKAV